MWTKIGTFCVILLLYVGSVRCSEGSNTPDQSGVLQFLRNILSKDSQQSQTFRELALGRSRRDAEKECGGTVPGGMGSLESPGFPKGYAQDLLCVWKIEAPASKQWLLRFMFFDVKGGSRGICSPGEDYVMMRDGSRTGQRLGIFCNALLSKSSLPSAILSVTNEVWIIFHTNSKDEGKGFLISFQSINSVKFSDYIADQVTFEPSTEVGSSSAGKSSKETKTTEAPITLLRRSSVNPATTFPFTQEGDQLTAKAVDTLSFESIAIGNPHLGPVHFGDSKGSFVDVTLPPPSDTPLSVTDLSMQPDYRMLPEGATATRTQLQSTSQLKTMSSTDGATLHQVLKTEQPVTQSKEQFAVAAKSFVVTNKQQEVTETELLPVAQTEPKILTQTEQISLLQSEQESVSPPDWQPATEVKQQLRTELQIETQAVEDTQVEQKTTAQAEQQPSTKAKQLLTPKLQFIITKLKTDEPGSVATSAGQFVSSTEELHASEAYYQPTTKSQEQFVIQTKQRSLPEFDFPKPVTETKLLPTSIPLPITVPGPYSVTPIRDVSEAKQQSVSKPDLRTKSWQQFVTQIKELPVTEVKQKPLTKPDELQPATKSLTTEQETVTQSQQLPFTASLLPTSEPGSQFVTQTDEHTNLNGLQQLTSFGQQVKSQTGKLQTDAKQQPVTKSNGLQLLTRPRKQYSFLTIQPSVTEIDNPEPGIQTGKQVGTEFYRTKTLTKYGQHYVIPTIVPSVAMAKTDVQQPQTQTEQFLTEIYELKPVTRRRQQSDSLTGPPDPQTDKPQYITELEKAGISSEQYIDTQTGVEDIGTEDPTQMFTHQEQVLTAEYQPKSTTEIAVKTFSDEPKETISQQYLSTQTESTTSTEQHPNVKTQWQALTKEWRKPSTTHAPEADIQQLTVPPSLPPTPFPPTPPPPYPDITPEPSLPSEDFDDPLTQSLSQVFNILSDVNLNDGRSIIQACHNLNMTMNETLEAFKSLSRLAQGLEYTKSLLPASTPVEMLRVNLSGDAALDKLQLFPFLLIQTLEVSVSDIISKASEFLNNTIQNASHIQSDVPEALCIRGYSQQLLNALQRDTSINGSLDLVEDMLKDRFGFSLTEKLGPGLGIDDDQPTLAPDGEQWDFNQVITNPSGELQSPNYPDAYPMGVRYRWNITVRPQERISLNFTHFDLDSELIHDQCDSRYAHVTVDDGSGLETGRKHVFCGQEVPNAIVSSSNTLIVTFKSSYGYGTGFHADFAMHKLGDVRDNRYSTTAVPDRVCGGVLTNQRGSIQSPNYPGDFETSVDCLWIVTVESGRTISLNFTDFNLDSIPTDNWCSESYAHLKVIDGINGSSHVYCGQEVPPLFISSTNTLTISFVNVLGFGGRFHAFYKTLQQDSKFLLTSKPDHPSTEPPHQCGGNLEDPTGVIQSPNYPGDFETSVDCLWIVTVESGLTISLYFTDFNLDSIPTDNWCSESYAHLKVIDGINGSSHVYCGKEVPPLFISSTNTLTISFASMFGYGGRFHAFYKTLQQDSKSLLTASPDHPSTEPPLHCGGNLEDRTGVIQSPNYPGDFETSVDCLWIVTIESGLTISLNFTDFNLDSFPTDNWCSESYAHLKVIDGIHGSSHVYCGQEVPPLFISSTNTLTISFASMFGYGGRFHAFYKTLQQDSKSLLTASPDHPSTEPPLHCGGNLEDRTGVIQSPNYPGDFETSVDCLWIVTVESGLTISLNFTDFNLDSFPTDNWCSKSYAHLKVIDGIHGSSHVYCGQEVPPLFISSTNTLTISFVSVFGFGGRFYAFYKTLQQDSKSLLTASPDHPSTEPPHHCGGNLEDPTGVIQSPNYPRDSETGVDCKWNVTVDPGLTITLNFTHFNLDSFPIDNWCSEGYAHVKVIDGIHGSSHVYCGQEVPLLFISSTNTLTVTFVSMFGYSGGFHAVYTALEQESKVLLTSPPDVKQTESVCGGNFKNPRGVIQLPDYSGIFEMGLSCQWNIMVGINAVISLTFTEFNLDSLPIENKCNEGYAHVKVIDGNLGKSNIYCGQELPLPFISTTNTLLVVFESLYGYSGRFRAVYRALQLYVSGSGDPELGLTSVQPSSMSVTEPLCGGSFNQPSGIIRLPEQTGDNCRWNITVDSGWIVLLTFTLFDIDSYAVDGQCDERYAHVKVIDRESAHIFCGQSIPPEVTSRSRTLIVDYVGVYGYGEGFEAIYVVRDADFEWLDARQVTAAVSSPSKSTQALLLTDKSPYQCGGDLNLPYGTIQSPAYSGEQATGVTCRWTITVGDKWLIQLAFTYFNLDSASINGQCDQRYDYLKIIDVNTKDGSSEFVYCGQDFPNIYVSSSNYLTIIFYTSYGLGGGFTAEYTVVEPDRILTNTLSPSTSKLPSAVLPYECGGDISAPTGEIKSPNFRGDYTTGVNCVWKFTLEANSKVALSFTVFDVDSMPFENECDTRYAHVSVIDGSSEETSPQRIYCGQDLPDDFVSTSNSLIIAFISRNGYGDRFQARYSSLKLDDDYFRLFPSTSIPSEKTVSQSQPTSKTDKQIVDCGGVLDTPDGVIQSPYLPTMEKALSVNCQWYIELQEAGTITVVFKYFDLDSVLFENGCQETYANLKFINTRTGASQVYCGQDVPPSFVASTNKLLIIFSGLYGFSRGFSVEYHSTKPLPSVDPTTVAVLPTSGSALGRQLPPCGGILTGDYAEISSPGYPNSYPIDTSCSWNIFVDSTHFIALKFLDFDVDNPMVQPDCSIHYSYVRVSYSGEGGIEETHLLCGSEQPEILKMRTHSVVVYFESNLGMGRGFKASYQAYSSSSSDVRTTAIPAATESVVSTVVSTAQSGQILSPNYPVQFPHNIDKLWIIRPARQTFITLIFEDIDFDATTGENGQCNTLYTHVALTTYNIDSGNSELLFCSNERKAAVYSYGELKLAFHSTYGDGRGFKAAYSSDFRTGDIGFVTKEPVTPTPRHSQPMTSKESVMKTPNPGEEFSDGCLYTLTQERGHFSSPNYPGMYPQEVVCQWSMLAPTGRLVRLDFSQFLLDSGDFPACDTKYSHLVVTTSDSYGGRDYTYCGQQLPPRIISPTNRLVVTFRSMFGIDFGFFAAYQFISAETYQGSFGPVFTDGDKSTSATGQGSDAGKTSSPMRSQEVDSATQVTEGSLISDAPCERVISNPEGVIRSPYFPQGMPQGEECTWTITVPGEQGIHLSFLDFSLDDHEVDTSTCFEDSASVSVLMDGSHYEFCGNMPPSPLISTGNSVVIELKTMSGNGQGFRMHFIDASLRSAGSVTSHITGDITESRTPVVDFRFLGEGGMTVPPDGDKRDFTQPGKDRVKVPVQQPEDITASTPVSNVETDAGMTATVNLMMTASKDNIATLPGYTSQAKVTGIGSTADSGDVLTSHQLRITAIVCGSVSFILFILLILLTTICIYKRRRRHSSKSVKMGQSEKSYWQNYKSWARDYSGGPNKPEVADEEGMEAVPIPEQERLV